MVRFFFFLSSLLISSFNQFEEILEIPITNNNGNYLVNISLGNSNHINLYSINLDTPFILSNNKYYNNTNSQAIQKSLIQNGIKYDIYNDIFKIRLIKGTILILMNFQFFYLFNDNKNYPCLGLAHNITNHYPLIHQLYQAKLIHNLTFAFYDIDNKTLFYVGGIPQRIKDYYSYKGTCISRYNTQWNCEIQKVLVNKMKFNHKYTLSFTTNQEKFYAPK